MNPAIKTAINIVGSQKKLGAACEVSQQAVYKWLHNKAKVSPEHVGSIVTATGGVVKAYQIRPDLPKLFPHTEKAPDCACFPLNALNPKSSYVMVSR